MLLKNKKICNLCGSISFRLYKRVKSLYSDDWYDLIRCRVCGLVCVSNEISHKDLIDQYRDNENTVFYFKEKEETDKIIFCYLIKEVLQYLKFEPGMRLLDIGCGIGTFLKTAKSKGFHVTGLEPNVQSVTYAKETYGLNIIQGHLQEATFTPESFDLITIIQTLEHVPDPLGALKRSNKILKKKGMIFIEVPNLSNIYCLSNRFLNTRDRSHTFDPTAHLYYFTSMTLKKIVQSAGFSPISIYSGFNQSMLQIFFNRRALSNIFLKNILFVPYRILCRLSNFLKIGMSIRIIAIKE
ncbi:MAG: class I SAM-dependent methyltransferase [Nitrospirae bacterium]|nr:class I SAM-dependent methyltransferase [Nitrospirota bacterium]